MSDRIKSLLARRASKLLEAEQMDSLEAAVRAGGTSLPGMDLIDESQSPSSPPFEGAVSGTGLSAARKLLDSSSPLMSSRSGADDFPPTKAQRRRESMREEKPRDEDAIRENEKYLQERLTRMENELKAIKVQNDALKAKEQQLEVACKSYNVYISELTKQFDVMKKKGEEDKDKAVQDAVSKALSSKRSSSASAQKGRPRSATVAAPQTPRRGSSFASPAGTPRSGSVSAFTHRQAQVGDAPTGTSASKALLQRSRSSTLAAKPATPRTPNTPHGTSRSFSLSDPPPPSTPRNQIQTSRQMAMSFSTASVPSAVDVNIPKVKEDIDTGAVSAWPRGEDPAPIPKLENLQAPKEQPPAQPVNASRPSSASSGAKTSRPFFAKPSKPAKRKTKGKSQSKAKPKPKAAPKPPTTPRTTTPRPSTPRQSSRPSTAQSRRSQASTDSSKKSDKLKKDDRTHGSESESESEDIRPPWDRPPDDSDEEDKEKRKMLLQPKKNLTKPVMQRDFWKKGATSKTAEDAEAKARIKQFMQNNFPEEEEEEASEEKVRAQSSAEAEESKEDPLPSQLQLWEEANTSAQNVLAFESDSEDERLKLEEEEAKQKKNEWRNRLEHAAREHPIGESKAKKSLKPEPEDADAPTHSQLSDEEPVTESLDVDMEDAAAADGDEDDMFAEWTAEKLQALKDIEEDFHEYRKKVSKGDPLEDLAAELDFVAEAAGPHKSTKGVSNTGVQDTIDSMADALREFALLEKRCSAQIYGLEHTIGKHQVQFRRAGIPLWEYDPETNKLIAPEVSADDYAKVLKHMSNKKKKQ